MVKYWDREGRLLRDIVEEEINDMYHLKLGEAEDMSYEVGINFLIYALNGTFEFLHDKTYVYNWKVNIENLDNPEVFYKISKIDKIRQVRFKRLERDKKIKDILEYENYRT